MDRAWAVNCSRSKSPLFRDRGKLTITGQLGDVMQESAQAAMSYVRSRAEQLGLKHVVLSEDRYPHSRAGGRDRRRTALRLVSRWRPRWFPRSAACRSSNDLAMTGEITLRGRVLPIGGLKEKVLAAHRGGIKTVLIPKENEKDIEEIPAQVLKNMTSDHGRSYGRGVRGTHWCSPIRRPSSSQRAARASR